MWVLGAGSSEVGQLGVWVSALERRSGRGSLRLCLTKFPGLGFRRSVCTGGYLDSSLCHSLLLPVLCLWHLALIPGSLCLTDIGGPFSLLVYPPIGRNKCPYLQLPEVCSVHVTAQALLPRESIKAAFHQLELCPRLALRLSSAGPSPACVTAKGDLLWTTCPLSHPPCSLTSALAQELRFALKVLFL